MMKLIWQNQLSIPEKQALMNLWNAEYPAQLSYQNLSELETYLGKLPKLTHLLLKEEQGQIAGWYFQFLRNEEQWFGILINSQFQGQGLGKKMLAAAMNRVDHLNGWVADHDRDTKMDGTAYPSPIGFYLKLGFKVLSEDRMKNEKVDVVRIKWRNT